LRFDRTAQPPRYRYLEVVRIFLRAEASVPDGLLPWAARQASELVSRAADENGVEAIGQEMPNFRVALAYLPSEDPDRWGVGLVNAL
ncbi:hypothetical protein ABTN34_18060, partial [Acinetobacter baumannii]